MAVWLWSLGVVTLGDVALAAGLAHRVVAMSGLVMWTSIGIFDNVGQVQEGMRTIARPRALVDRTDARALVASRGAIRFENVRFHYGKGAGVIENLSLSIAPGEKVGLVGRSGAGKSTLVNLLLRFYDVEGGRILIDGQDIASGDARQLAPADRHGHAGHLAVAPLDRREHPLRPARGVGRRDDRGVAPGPRA